MSWLIFLVYAAIPKNFQKDRVCALAMTRERERLHQSISCRHMWLLVSQLWWPWVCTSRANWPDCYRCWSEDHWRILPWGALNSKATACYASEVEICEEFFIFQQGNVAAHWAQTINLQERDPCIHFIRPFATQYHRSGTVDYKIRGEMQQRV